jgi:hypothetical protein
MIDRPHFPLPQRRPARAAPPPPPRSARTPPPPSSPQRRPSLRRWTVPSAAAAPVLRRRRGEWRRGPRCRGHDAASLSVVEASLGIRRRRHRCRDDDVCDLGPGRALLLLHPCSCRRRGAWRWRPTKPRTRRGVTPSLWERRVDTTAAAANATEAIMPVTLNRLCPAPDIMLAAWGVAPRPTTTSADTASLELPKSPGLPPTSQQATWSYIVMAGTSLGKTRAHHSARHSVPTSRGATGGRSRQAGHAHRLTPKRDKLRGVLLALTLEE